MAKRVKVDECDNGYIVHLVHVDPQTRREMATRLVFTTFHSAMTAISEWFGYDLGQKNSRRDE